MVDVSSGSGKEEQKTVSLQDFVTSHWQMLTIFGVFAGFTNYLSNTDNAGLITLGFLLTFIVELEILQLLLKIKNKSLILKAFTFLSVVFILFFAGFIYSNMVSDTLSGFGVTIYPIIMENRVWIVRIIFFISLLVVAISSYRHVRSLLFAVLPLLARVDRRMLAGFSLALLVLVAATVIWLNRVPGGGQSVSTSTTLPQIEQCRSPLVRIAGECCMDADNNTLCDELVIPVSSTTSTLIACSTNSDCGNQTQIRICYKGDVYLQQVTPICQKPGTPEVRCVYRTSLVGETITTAAIPVERCFKGCENGSCI